MVIHPPRPAAVPVYALAITLGFFAMAAFSTNIPLLGVGLVAAVVALFVGQKLARRYRPAEDDSAIEAAIDEGGVRLPRGRQRYVRFEDVTSIERRPGRVILETRKGTVAEIPGTKGQLEAFVRTVEARRMRAAPTRVGRLLARRKRKLAEWLKDLRRLARDEGYRGGQLSREEVLAIALDPRQRLDVRAAATFVALERDDDDGRARVRSALGAATPPLVVGLAALAGDVETSAIARVLAGPLPSSLKECFPPADRVYVAIHAPSVDDEPQQTPRTRIETSRARLPEIATVLSEDDPVEPEDERAVEEGRS